LFDQLARNPAYNENARHRRRLRELFEAEANAVAILQHPNIVRVTDYGEHRGVPFLVMDYIRGRTLQQVVQRRESMAMTRRLRLMEDLCEGLGYAHNKELVHRDIKPANLIIESDSQRLKILDFGVVRSMEVTAQRTMTMGVPIGTLCYMSPEQTRASRTLDNRSDIFSVGLVFYELLTYQRA
jgi:serine/threonine-protein kinase